ncbi:MAG: hypothetical protein ABIK62_00310 [candidate division WOR-3 bacterium]
MDELKPHITDAEQRHTAPGQGASLTGNTRRLKRRAFAIIIGLLALTVIAAGVMLGDPETIHRFAAQI